MLSLGLGVKTRVCRQTMDSIEPTDRSLSGGAPPSMEADQGSQWQLRLAISIPALLTLFMLAYGLISYELFAGRWTELEKAGAAHIAGGLLRGHLYAMLILSALAMTAGLGLAFTILRPIRAINETARMIASGRLDQRAPRLSAARELGDLSRSFNSMIDFVNESIHERNRHLVEGIVTGILTASLDGTVSALNTTGSRILGVESSAIVGHTPRELKDALPSKHRPFWEYLESAAGGRRTPMPDEIVLSSGEGSTSLLVAMSTLRDGDGMPFAIMLNFRDADEIRVLKEQLSKTDQLAALGTFTMGLAHELRNPLGSIKGMVQLLKLEESTPANTGEIVDRVSKEVDRLDLFIRELLDFSNQSPAPPALTDVNEILKDAARLAQRDASEAALESIELAFDFAPAPAILAEADRLTQAFANIIRNAYEAARPGSRITLRTRAKSEDGRDTFEARIHNTGSSIDMKNRTKVFDPFFSTKERGSGLGLPIAYQIISQNLGTLDLAAGPDDVTFIARFPAVSPTGVRASKTIAISDQRTLEEAHRS